MCARREVPASARARWNNFRESEIYIPDVYYTRVGFGCRALLNHTPRHVVIHLEDNRLNWWYIYISCYDNGISFTFIRIYKAHTYSDIHCTFIGIYTDSCARSANRNWMLIRSDSYVWKSDYAIHTVSHKCRYRRYCSIRVQPAAGHYAKEMVILPRTSSSSAFRTSCAKSSSAAGGGGSWVSRESRTPQSLIDATLYWKQYPV